MNARWEQDGTGGLFGFGYFDFGEGEIPARFEEHRDFLAFRLALKKHGLACKKAGRAELLEQIGGIAP